MDSQPAAVGRATGGPTRNQLVLPLVPSSHGLVLVIARGPSIDLERIHAWLHIRAGATVTGSLMATFDADLADCAVIYDQDEHHPVLKLGQASFRISKHSAHQVRSRFAFRSQRLRI